MNKKKINILLVEDEAAHAELVKRSFDKNDNEISFKCKAIWVKKMEFGKYYIGFTITDIDRDAQLKLKNFVQYLLQGE